jgi:hypothetical protein
MDALDVTAVDTWMDVAVSKVMYTRDVSFEVETVENFTTLSRDWLYMPFPAVVVCDAVPGHASHRMSVCAMTIQDTAGADGVEEGYTVSVRVQGPLFSGSNKPHPATFTPAKFSTRGEAVLHARVLVAQMDLLRPGCTYMGLTPFGKDKPVIVHVLGTLDDTITHRLQRPPPGMTAVL